VPGQRAEGVKMRGVPLHDDLWGAVKAKAASEGRSRAEVIRELLRAYVEGTITLPDLPPQ